MPNIRIAFMISKFRYDLDAEGLNTSSEAESRKDDQPSLAARSFIARACIRVGTQAAARGGQTRARRSRSAAASRRGRCSPVGQGAAGAEGAGTDPLRGVGEERQRLGFSR